MAPASPVQRVWLVALAALAMTVLEGAFRKWVPGFGGGAAKYLMYFSKDLIFAALLFYPQRSQPSPALQVFGNWLVPGCSLLLAGAAISCAHGLNPVGAVLTARAVVVLPFIAWLVVPRLAGLPLRQVVGLLTILTIFTVALGVEQNRLPADHLLNRYADADMQVIEAASGVRATGTFAYIAGLALISSAGIWAGLVGMGMANSQRQRLVAWVALAAGMGCALASISRSPVVIGLAMILGWLVSAQDGLSIFLRGLFVGVLGLAVAAALGVTGIFSNLGSGLLERQATAGDTFSDRAFGPLSEMVRALQLSPLGNGFGSEQVGGQFYTTGQAGFNHFESALPRLVMEAGAWGLLGYLVVCAGAILALQRAKRGVQSSGAKSALTATQLFLLPMFYGAVIFNHTASAFAWLIFAVVLAAAELNPQAKPAGVKTELEPSVSSGQKTWPPRPNRDHQI